ncbi:hypothetical protein Tco_1407352 [Tanacetum coccineum]
MKSKVLNFQATYSPWWKSDGGPELEKKKKDDYGLRFGEQENPNKSGKKSKFLLYVFSRFILMFLRELETSLVIMEYLVNISKRRAFWSLNEDILKIVVLTINTLYPSRKIRRICACAHQRPRRKHDQYVVSREDQYAVLEIMTKVIKGEFEKLEDLMVKDVSLTCDTSLEVFNNEFNRMSKMDDDLFTYEVEVANIPCNSNKDDDSEKQMSHEANDDMGYDPSDIYWIRGDDEVELIDEESSDNEDEVTKVFRINTNIFDFETPMCKAFNEFNYLLKIVPNLLTKEIEGFKTYGKYKDDWIYEWNENMPWVHEKPWTVTGVWTEPAPVVHYCKLFNYKSGYSE